MGDLLRRRPEARNVDEAPSEEETPFSRRPIGDERDSSPQTASPNVNFMNFATFAKIAILLGTVVTVFLLTRDSDYFLRTAKDSSENVPKDGASQQVQSGKTVVNGVTIYTKDELAKFTGADRNLPVLLAYMGKVYDVSKGRRHYGPGGSYQFFSGRDATRSFLTGDFQNDLNDNLDGISDSQFGEIENWENTYSKSADYKFVGVLCGNFYQCAGDENPGQPTEKLLFAQKMAEKAKATAAKDQEIFVEFPQCNSEWSQEKGGRVWCSSKSGGIDRKWTGYPRLFLTQKDGKKSTRCACVHPDKLTDPRVEMYPSCPSDSDSCKLQQQ